MHYITIYIKFAVHYDILMLPPEKMILAQMYCQISFCIAMHCDALYFLWTIV